jgi:hypothetical protein
MVAIFQRELTLLTEADVLRRTDLSCYDYVFGQFDSGFVRRVRQHTIYDPFSHLHHKIVAIAQKRHSTL